MQSKKICDSCFARREEKDTFCSGCGKKLRTIIYEDEADIIVKALGSDSIPGIGFHLRCGGVVERRKDSFGKSVLLCTSCFLRVRR